MISSWTNVWEICKLGHNIVHTFTILSKIGFAMDCSIAYFSLSYDKTVKICVLTSWQGPCHQFQTFQGFFSNNFLIF